SFELGLAKKERHDLYLEKKNAVDKILEFVSNFSIKPQYIDAILEAKGSSTLKQGVKLIDIILRPQLSVFDLTEDIVPFKNFLKFVPQERFREILESAEIAIKYAGYIDRERLVADKFRRLENINITGRFDYQSMLTISTEARQKLTELQPETIGQASRISGVSPSDINVLLVLLGR
ncbi:MAG TPA: tRNA uridine-5-carboxymethylaminomethyl(34) synthesis enzyme MnmG, partial [Prolixibacteraceae bacterium]|nr:tRNA uridine-5-carboxymethylaminomethyl(34) synthesis enzyme MnmG [Prolixibacteraceae bacterium]